MMKRILKALFLLLLNAIFLVKGLAQDNMNASEQLDFGITIADSKMVEKGISRGAGINLEHLISSISLINFPDGKGATHKTIFGLILNKIPNANGVSKNGETVLTSLAKSHPYGQKAESPLEIAQLLIAKGSKVNEPNKEGRTALNILCDADIFMDMENRLSFASLLLTNGANKEFQSNEHMTSDGTPLMNAAANGYYDLVKLLLDKGSNPNAQNDGGETALMKVLKAKQTAVSNEEKKGITQLLMSKGADPKKKDSNGETVLDLAKQEDLSFLFDAPAKSSVAKVPAKQQMVEVPGYGSMKANELLALSLVTGDFELVKKAVNAGADVNMMSSKNERPLEMASGIVCQNNLKIVTYLLENGAVLNYKDGHSALVKAVESAAFLSFSVTGAKYYDLILKGSPAIVETTKEEEDYKKRYPEFIEIVKLFIKKGAKIDGSVNTNSEGYTPLMIATTNGDLTLVKLLLQHGASVKIKPFAGDRGLMLLATASAYMGYKYANLMESEGGTEKDYEGAIKMGLPKEHIDGLKSRKKIYKDYQAKWIDLFSNYTEITKLLISKGADVNVRHSMANGKPVTPLRQAKVYHNTPMITALVAAGAK